MIETCRGVVEDGSLILQQEQQFKASGRPGPNVRSGDLRRGIQTTAVVQKSEGTFEGGTHTTMAYSRVQEKGAIIYPKRGMFLVWTDGPRPVSPEGWRAAQKAGLVHRARMVRIPARPFMKPGEDAAAPKYRDLAQKRFAATLGGH